MGQRSEDNVRNSSLTAHEQYLKEFHLTYDQSRTKSHGLVLNSAAHQQLQGMLAAPKLKKPQIDRGSDENVPNSGRGEGINGISNIEVQKTLVTVSTDRDRNQVVIQGGLIERAAQDQEQTQPNRGANTIHVQSSAPSIIQSKRISLEQISLVLNEAGGGVEAEEQPGDRPRSSVQLQQPNEALVAGRQSVPSKAASQVKQSPEYEKRDSSRDN